MKPTRKASFGDFPDHDCEMNQSSEPALFKLRAPSIGDDSDMVGSEEQDQMHLDQESVSQMSHSDLAFRQLDFLWLFDPYLNFKQRPNFKLDDAMLTLDDYE